MIVSEALCLFCGVLPATSEEHIVLNALGGRRTTGGLLCRPCNNRFGGTIDAAMEQEYRWFSLIAGCWRGDGKPVAPIRNAHSVEGNRYEILHGGTGQPLRPVTVRLDHGEAAEERHLRVYDEGVLARMLSAEARRLGVPPRDIKLEALSTRGLDFTNVKFGLSAGGDQYRVVLKMGLAAACRERVLLRNRETREAALFVLGEKEVDKGLDPKAATAIRTRLSTEPGQHVLLVHQIAGRWEAVFLVFGIVGMRVALPEPAPGFEGVAHVVDPVQQRHEIVQAPPAMPLKPLRDLDFDLRLMRPMIDELQRCGTCQQL